MTAPENDRTTVSNAALSSREISAFPRLSDYNAPFLVEMTNTSQAGYAASSETQY